jgi:hypothetical protein
MSDLRRTRYADSPRLSLRITLSALNRMLEEISSKRISTVEVAAESTNFVFARWYARTLASGGEAQIEGSCGRAPTETSESRQR